MDNRREHDRFRYPAAERPTIRLEFTDPPRPLTGALLDLGVQGMRIRLDEDAPALRLDDSCTAHLDLPGLGTPLTIPCAVVYLERIAGAQDCGFCFLPLLVPAAEERRAAVLEQYLASAQRRHRPVRRRARTYPRLFTGK